MRRRVRTLVLGLPVVNLVGGAIHSLCRDQIFWLGHTATEKGFCA